MTAGSPFKPFHSKILLFGEHLVNLGGDALTIPYHAFSGTLTINENSDHRLDEYLDFLVKQKFEFLDQDKLNARPKLSFNSNIPEGYGAGSSGALVAACFEFFSSRKNATLKELKTYFSQMESYFHGVSSGTDPLVSFMNKPIRFSSDGDIKIVDPICSIDGYELVLIDSGHGREGKTYINWFMQLTADSKFKNHLNDVLIPASQSCIEYCCGNLEVDYLASFRTISRFQYDYMKKMIPDHIQTLWASGLNSENYFLKICGAGGGGFFIGMVKKNSVHLLSDQLSTYSLT